MHYTALSSLCQERLFEHSGLRKSDRPSDTAAPLRNPECIDPPDSHSFETTIAQIDKISVLYLPYHICELLYNFEPDVHKNF